MTCLISGVGVRSDMFSGMSDEDVIRRAYTDDADAILREIGTRLDLTFKEFCDHCTVLDGQLGDYFLSGLKVVAPNVYGAIPDCKDVVRFVALCRVLNNILKQEERKNDQ